MKHYLLDTSALLTLRDDEQGAELQDACLVHKDPDFKVIDSIEQKPLPYR